MAKQFNRMLNNPPISPVPPGDFFVLGLFAQYANARNYVLPLYYIHRHCERSVAIQ